MVTVTPFGRRVATGVSPEPDGLFDQRAGAVVFAEQVAGFVVGVQNSAVDAAADLNPLAEGVVDRDFSARAVGQRV
jgi:hypothetical protein